MNYVFCFVYFCAYIENSIDTCADVCGYVTNVGLTAFTKSGSKTLEFYLANER